MSERKCWKCGTVEDLDDAWKWKECKRAECYKCSIKLRYPITLPKLNVAPDWISKAKASQQRILERYR